ncbi:hypothetical protein ACIO3S_24575 [Nocardioides sp. NPDC087217]|uniref:hypothetical protein n=1 Tax=Nocardioides sp. NPDC087217 TaxID=3364335 RepID=UPI00381CA6D1
MLYRLTPPGQLESADFPSGAKSFKTALEQGADFDRLEWQRAKDRVFSSDILRIALRHGVPSAAGIVLTPMHITDLGRADELKLVQQQADELHAQNRRQSGARNEARLPGWTKAGEQLDDEVRATTERAVRESEARLAKVLAAPVDPALADHWVQLGGQLPD